MKSVNVGIVGALILILIGVGAWAPTDASAQTLTTQYSFRGRPADGAEPLGGLITDAAGNLYGTTIGGGGGNGNGTVFKLTPSGTETVLHSFTGDDGAGPGSALIADAAGNLYGTTTNGGSPSYGTVFKLTLNPDGTYTHSILHNFTGSPSDGSAPHGLIADAAGNLYGATAGGGGSSCGGTGCGTVFRLTPNVDGTYTESVLHSFTGDSEGPAGFGGSDGQYPFGTLIVDGASNLYGTTYYGGGSGCDGYGCGTVFKLTANLDGTYSEIVLYGFTGGRDGAAPGAGLLADAAGNFYGTTSEGGGSRTCATGCGTVFTLMPNLDGTYSESILHSFAGGSDGQTPYAGLIADAAGNLYGTTYAGGIIVGGFPDGCGGWCGTMFMLTPKGTLAVLHSFNYSDGANPQSALMADAVGNLYGTTSRGGSNNDGTVFKLTMSATFTGVPGMANCTGQSISFLTTEFGGIAHAATALGFATATDLQNAVAAYCAGS
jgi:uncharacterized repeat protein (TIGR03803 family)